jgi:hypothetical protein
MNGFIIVKGISHSDDGDYWIVHLDHPLTVFRVTIGDVIPYYDIQKSFAEKVDTINFNTWTVSVLGTENKKLANGKLINKAWKWFSTYRHKNTGK